jgi:hypothetical protein
MASNKYDMPNSDFLNLKLALNDLSKALDMESIRRGRRRVSASAGLSVKEAEAKVEASLRAVIESPLIPKMPRPVFDPASPAGAALYHLKRSVDQMLKSTERGDHQKAEIEKNLHRLVQAVDPNHPCLRQSKGIYMCLPWFRRCLLLHEG